MKNADMPAMPVITEKRVANTSVSECEFSGLTKREMFAMYAMQGICVNAGRNDCSFDDESIAVIAVQQADALIKELEK
ncbi:hypothetical protein NVP1197A_54 [Vibrio phage 1.197.A._10N.286.54.F2]|nr:hypothetical protein NVP1197A_54 [Vibrio phage 1.197.A._10N.286.54.F2]